MHLKLMDEKFFISLLEIKKLHSLMVNIKYIFSNFYKFIQEILKNQKIKRFSFTGSYDYWNKRYEIGGSSGLGSQNHLAQYKAEIINNFVDKYNIKSIIEFGCGDGNQLRLSNYPNYIGYDISKKAISQCQSLFLGDDLKSFHLMDEYNGEMADLTLSLDVIFHLVEDEIYQNYMEQLFDASNKFVIIYSSNIEQKVDPKYPHIKHRKFSNWIQKKRPSWQLIKHIPNRYPHKSYSILGSYSEFFIYEKITNQFNKAHE